MSEQRRLDVLRAIVEDYVYSREPVGSKALVERHQLGVSSATIRNDMALLEEEGLIAAPHTSAGRIPTDKGYRTFVDRITEVKPLSLAERRTIQRLLAGTGDLEDTLARTVRVLAQLTGQVALVQYPSSTTGSLRHAEFVQVSPHKALIVLILDNGKVEQGVTDLGQQLSADELSSLRSSFLEALADLPVTELEPVINTVVANASDCLKPAAAALAQSLAGLSSAARDDRVVVAGMANLARSTEDFPLSAGPVLDALEEQVVMLRLLSEIAQDSRGMAVSIGRENALDSFAEASVVATNYDRDASAKLGVIGPLRMDYPGSMAAVGAVAGYLSRILTG
ncbi:heat-inducible transcriptional repressor HrcA [Acaricomes phytoseiuli]|uniref:heat-inducible transcriptional repressor HrcA n=1 Tax=Acaricomes phytoseiuli TaxID=291968 RepID=UPI002223B4C7|nr:heat-inducible transcriptional repressor HrcA [Acaricomes phytoseiuli]MCW1249172.1 heat-inducible transcriptional repressor HrcA [Acaricomes phytoseiuli]